MRLHLPHEHHFLQGGNTEESSRAHSPEITFFSAHKEKEEKCKEQKNAATAAAAEIEEEGMESRRRR